MTHLATVDNSADFYKNLMPYHQFADMAMIGHYHPLPDNWYVLITDIVGSTKAIEAGKYKEVNMGGALAAIAIANFYGGMTFPFVFGGDGVTFLLPNQFLAEVKDLMADTRLVCQETLGLTLRVGFVAVSDLYAQGYELKLAKLQVSKEYTQAFITGKGLDFAESLIKDQTKNHAYLLPENYQPKIRASYAGFMCPFQTIQSPKDETISLIVKIIHPDELSHAAILVDILTELQQLLGGAEEYCPITPDTLRVDTQFSGVGRDASVVTKTTHGLKYRLMAGFNVLRNIGIQLQIHPNKWLTAVRKQFNYNPQKRIISCTDFRKYDGTLKMVVACTTEARHQIEQYLAKLHTQGVVVYGIHISDKALMTCLLHAKSDNEVHFVDSAGGGYALAAKQLKQQLAELNG